MNLKGDHLKLMQEAIAKLDCISCSFIKECQSSKHTYCKEINKWLKSIEEGNKFER